MILALARPIANPDRGFGGDGPLLLVVDDGWAAAAHWADRSEAMADLIRRADGLLYRAKKLGRNRVETDM